MLNIKEFFGKIQEARAREDSFRLAVQQTIKSISNVDVSVEDISLAGSTLRLKGQSRSALTAIFIKKEQLLNKMNGSQNIHTITDIR